MSKRDMFPYLPKPLKDGDNLYTSKKALNSERTILYWLLNNAIDHKLMTIDSDTDWNDLDNFSVYHFASLQGPHAPSGAKLGDQSGIVVCTSAGIGDHFQMAFTGYGAAFRSLHSDWFYIGQGIPADVDVSKLIDQPTLKGVLENYYTADTINNLLNKVLHSLGDSYVKYDVYSPEVTRQHSINSETNINIASNGSKINSLSYSASSDASVGDTDYSVYTNRPDSNAEDNRSGVNSMFSNSTTYSSVSTSSVRVSKANSLATLNYDNLTALTSYTDNATHIEHNGSLVPVKSYAENNSNEIQSMEDLAYQSNGKPYKVTESNTTYQLDTDNHSDALNPNDKPADLVVASSSANEYAGSVYANTSNVNLLMNLTSSNFNSETANSLMGSFNSNVDSINKASASTADMIRDEYNSFNDNCTYLSELGSYVNNPEISQVEQLYDNAATNKSEDYNAIYYYQTKQQFDNNISLNNNVLSYSASMSPQSQATYNSLLNSNHTQLDNDASHLSNLWADATEKDTVESQAADDLHHATYKQASNIVYDSMVSALPQGDGSVYANASNMYSELTSVGASDVSQLDSTVSSLTVHKSQANSALLSLNESNLNSSNATYQNLQNSLRSFNNITSDNNASLAYYHQYGPSTYDPLNNELNNLKSILDSTQAASAQETQKALGQANLLNTSLNGIDTRLFSANNTWGNMIRQAEAGDSAASASANSYANTINSINTSAQTAKLNIDSEFNNVYSASNSVDASLGSIYDSAQPQYAYANEALSSADSILSASASYNNTYTSISNSVHNQVDSVNNALSINTSKASSASTLYAHNHSAVISVLNHQELSAKANIREYGYDSFASNVQSGSPTTSLSLGLGSIYANASNINSLETSSNEKNYSEEFNHHDYKWKINPQNGSYDFYPNQNNYSDRTGSVFANESNIYMLSGSASSDASNSGALDNGSYTSLIMTSSNYSANASFAGGNNYSYDIMGNPSNGINPNISVSKTNSLAQLNYNNAMVLSEYAYNATHMYTSNTGDAENAYVNNGQKTKATGHTGVPIKEIVRSNSVSMNSEITSLAGTNQNHFSLSNMSVAFDNGYMAIKSSPINENQQSGGDNALGSIYANASNAAQIASAASLNTSSISSVSSSTDYRFNDSADPRFENDETSTTNRFDSGDTRFNSDETSLDSRATSDEGRIAYNNLIINQQMGFKDKSGQVERNIIQVIAVAGSGWNNNVYSFTQGHIIGYWILHNPRTSSNGTYPISQVGGAELMQGFQGYDGNDYQYTGGKTNVDFTTTQPFYIRVCKETDDYKETTDVNNMTAMIQSNGTPIGSAISSIASSAAKSAANSAESWVNGQGFRRF